jgi:hypothetical protein
LRTRALPGPMRALLRVLPLAAGLVLYGAVAGRTLGEDVVGGAAVAVGAVAFLLLVALRGWSPLRAAGAFAAGAALVPFVRLATWNAHVVGEVRGQVLGLAWALLLLAALGGGTLAAGWGAARVAEALWARTRPGAVVAVALAAGLAAFLWPVACDSRESFEEVPNQRCACEGLVVVWYPPGVSDASDIHYCVGRETPPAHTFTSRTPRTAFPA